MKKITCIVGARPQFIKHFPLELELSKEFEVNTIHTGQHYDENMSKIFFNELNLKHPDHMLDLSKTSHAGQTSEMLYAIEKILIDNKTDYVLVYGDTNSTLAGALAASKLNIPIIHVEAGLRSYNKSMPEEINRVLTDHMSDVLFCSSETGRSNLASESINENVIITGDLMKDAFFKIKNRRKNNNKVKQEGSFCLTTLHRPYNTDNFERLKLILDNLNKLDLKIIFPIHPRTNNLLKKNNCKIKEFKNIHFKNPFGYLEMLNYLVECDSVITDSGGVQKEAYWAKKKCTTLRPETEWVETLEGNWNRLVFNDLKLLQRNIDPIEKMYDPKLYGDGNSANKILNNLKEIL